MNDYKFGNEICKMRNELHLSQAQLAEKIGVSNKAISKRENGVSKPTTNTLRRLACVFNIPVEQLLSLREREPEPKIVKIVITGGPCAGKSTAMSWIQNAFTQMGYTVLFVPETATELIMGGIAPWTCASNAEYQKCQMKLQIQKEIIFKYAAQTMATEKVLIVCDRGVLDNKAYMDEAEFSEALRYIGSNEVELRDGYDAVFHLVTAAKDAKEFYSTENNSARTETAEEEAELDDKLISAWTGHPHFRVVDNSTDFDGKIRRLIAEILRFLGEPEPLEIERKFLIEYPDIKWLENQPNCQKVEIIQTYLKSDRNEEANVVFPQKLKVIKEVTDDDSYKNSDLASLNQ